MSPVRRASPDASPPAAVVEPTDDDLLLGDVPAEHLESSGAEPAAVPSKRQELPEGVGLQDLFGDFEEADGIDAEHLDLAATALFGEHVADIDAAPFDLKAHKELIAAVEHESRFADVEDCFGGAAAALCLDARDGFLGAASVLSCPRPEHPLPAAAAKETWLLDMPKLHPARQVLHMAPRAFDSTLTDVPESNSFELHTPHNTMRWAVGKDKVLTNARFIRWSDESVTLHVGRDVFEIKDNNDALTFIANPAPATVDGHSETAFVSSVPVHRHASLRLTALRVSSIDDFLQREVSAHAKVELSKAVPLPVPGIPTALAPRDIRAAQRDATAEEEFLERERKAREKKLRGKAPMSLGAVLNADLDLLDTLVNATRDANLDEVFEESRQKAAPTRSGDAKTARKRLERNTELEVGAGFENGTGEVAPGKRSRSPSHGPEAQERGAVVTLQRELKALLEATANESLRGALEGTVEYFNGEVSIEAANEELERLRQEHPDVALPALTVAV